MFIYLIRIRIKKRYRMDTNDANSQVKFLIGKKIYIYLQSKIKLEGILCGFDQFMNLTVKNLNLFYKKKKKKIGTSLIRGHLVISLEASNESLGCR